MLAPKPLPTFGGMEVPDDGMVRLWPLKEVTESADRSDFGLLFADYMIDSWCFRLKPVSSEASAVLRRPFHRRSLSAEQIHPNSSSMPGAHLKIPTKVADYGTTPVTASLIELNRVGYAPRSAFSVPYRVRFP